MALLQNRSDQRSQLQEKIAKDLKAKISSEETTYVVPESTLLEDQHTTNARSLLWVVIVGLIVISNGMYIFLSK